MTRNYIEDGSGCSKILNTFFFFFLSALGKNTSQVGMFLDGVIF